MSDFAFTHHYRWIGNYVVSAIAFVVLQVFAARKTRPTWISGAAILCSTFVALFFAAAAIDHFSPPVTSGWGPRFSLPFVFTWFSALPIQLLFNLACGEDNIFEEHLMIPTALLMWSLVGAFVGALKTKFGSKANAQKA